ncbi:MAG: Fic family protein [Gemmatimonadaceae bacterium]
MLLTRTIGPNTRSEPARVARGTVNCGAEPLASLARLIVVPTAARGLTGHGQYFDDHYPFHFQRRRRGGHQLLAGQFIQTLWRPRATIAREVTGEVGRLLEVMTGVMKRQKMQDALGLKHEDHFREAHLIPALDAGLIEMTIPGKPTSRLQKYRLTDKGRAWLTAGKKSEK